MPRRPSVFISYASQDRGAARLIRDGLMAAGIEAWYDENELGGGDVWDQKIRRQIRECVYFLPVISANTEARKEGYFRREWRLAAERTLDMADDVTFLVPIVIDGTGQDLARVPEKFLASQWLRMPGGQVTPAFQSWCARVTSDEPPELPAGRSGKPNYPPRPEPGAPAAPRDAALHLPPFPLHVPGQNIKFLGDIAVWLLHTTVAIYRWCPRWARILIILWLIAMGIKGCSASGPPAERHAARAGLTPGQAKKIESLSRTLKSTGTADLVRQLTKQFGSDHDASPSLYAVAFGADPEDAAGTRFANEVFAAVYGRLAVENPAAVELDKAPADSRDGAAALSNARDEEAKYVLRGQVAPSSHQLTVILLDAAAGSTTWTHDYPVDGSAPAAVAEDIRLHLPALSSPP